MSQQLQEFRVGDEVVGTSVNLMLEGRRCVITKITENDGIYFDYEMSYGWQRNANVWTFSVFRKLTKLEKALK